MQARDQLKRQIEFSLHASALSDLECYAFPDAEVEGASPYIKKESRDLLLTPSGDISRHPFFFSVIGFVVLKRCARAFA